MTKGAKQTPKTRPPIKVTVTTRWTQESARHYLRVMAEIAAEQETAKKKAAA